jgi:uncharacterized protein YdhG (YjbR/CyaY superfamily)
MNEEVQRFYDAIPEDRRPLFDRIRAIIETMYREAEVKLSYGVPTFKVKSGWVALGYWKNGVSLYTNGPHHLSRFIREHPDIKTGKGSINFSMTDDIPEESLSRVIRHAMDGLKEAT